MPVGTGEAERKPGGAPFAPLKDRGEKRMTSNVPPMQGQQTMPSMQGQQTMPSMQGQPVTGMPDDVYGLVSIIYLVMKGGATTESYIQDAQRSGDNDLLVF